MADVAAFFQNMSSKQKKLLLWHCVIFSLYIIKVLMNPLEVDQYADKLAADFYNVVYSPFYGKTEEGQTTASIGQDEIVVLLYDKAYLDGPPAAQWPVPISSYSRLLRRLVQAGSLGIFIDINFLGGGERETQLAGLYETAENLEQVDDSKRYSYQTGTTIVFSGTASRPVPSFDNRLPLNYGLISSTSDEQSYALYASVDESNMPPNLARDIRQNLIISEEDGSTSYLLPTAAYRMYEIWCERNGCTGLNQERALEHELFLKWGYSPSEGMTDYYQKTGKTCEPDNSDSLLGKLEASLKLLFTRLDAEYDDITNPADCMYQSNYSIRYINNLRVVNPNLLTEEENFQSTVAGEAEYLSDLVKGKIVFIGADIPQYPDMVFSPVQRYIPGVFRHAMALDNLIESRQGFSIWVDDNESVKQELVVFSVIYGSFVIFSIWLSRLGFSEEADSLLQIHVWYSLLIVLLLSIIISSTIHVQNWAPNDWLNYLLMFFIVGLETITLLLKKSVALMMTNPVITFLKFVFFSLLGFIAIVLVSLGPITIFNHAPSAANLFYLFIMALYLSGIVYCLYSMKKIANRKGETGYQLPGNLS